MSSQGPGAVGAFKVLKDLPRRDEALALLQKLHSLCKPIQKKYGWYLPELCEFEPRDPNLLGMNMGRGQKIFIRLRPKHDTNTFLPLEESLVGTLLHEFSHNMHGPHDKNFYAFLDKLQDEYDVLRSTGYTGEGFLGNGNRMGGRHNLSPYDARAKALAEAERRNKLAKLMGPPGGRTLGGGANRTTGKSPRELAADAAERRARDAKSCGHGEAVSDAVIAEEATQAENDSVDSSSVEGELTHSSTSTSSSSTATTSTSIAMNAASSCPASGDSDSDIEIISPPLKKQAVARSKTVGSSAESQLDRAQAHSVPKVHDGDHTTNLQFWTCSACTFDNGNPLTLSCEVCGSERSSVWGSRGFAEPYNNPLRARKPQQNLVTASGWICQRCGGETEHDFWTCKLCGILKLSS